MMKRFEYRRQLIVLSVLTTVFASAVSAAIFINGNASAGDPIFAGLGGTSGSVAVTDGTVLTSANNVAIGGNPESRGALRLTDPGTMVNVGGGPGNAIDVGFDRGNGSVRVSNGARLTVDAFVSPGFSDARLNIGRGGVATSVFESGAQVLVRDLNLAGSDDGVFVGTSEDFPTDSAGTGTLTVQDEGTYLEVSGNLAFLNTGVSNTFFPGRRALVAGLKSCEAPMS